MITGCNALATRMLHDRWRTNSLLLLGPKGSGKSHLTHIWQEKNLAVLIDLHTLDLGREKAKAFILKDADKISWKNNLEEKTFHLLNYCRENNIQILITATMAPAHWPLQLADLRSRLLAIDVAPLEQPDDSLVAGLLLKHFGDRQLRVDEEILNYLVPRIARDGGVIADIVGQIDAAALRDKRAITIPLIRQTLQNNSTLFD